ncbi:hypothetical protein NKDENANG_02398 [Candidatus Entotheonellaceae bacterium PAL068K]
MTHVQRWLDLQRDETPDEQRAKLEHRLAPYRMPLETGVPLLAQFLDPLPTDLKAGASSVVICI